jgi:hypothetical protein
MIDWITPPPIRLRHIALLLLGGIVAGSLVGLLTGMPAYGFTHSKFVVGMVFMTSLYGSFILGYHWFSQEQGWISLRARFSPVGRKPLILGAVGAVATIAFISMVRWILLKAGVKLAEVPLPIQLDTWTQLPLALFVLVVVAP